MGLEEVARAVRNKSQLWNVLRIAIFMMRRGLLKSTALLQEDLQVLRKRGVKVFGKNLQLFHRHHMSTSPRGFGLLDHEFSCSNSLGNPPFNFTKKKLSTSQHYFSCIQPQTVESPTFAAASWLQQMNTIQSWGGEQHGNLPAGSRRGLEFIDGCRRSRASRYRSWGIHS